MQRFDVLFGDEIVTGVVLAGRKHNIPTISQSIGPLSPTARLQPPFLERSDLAREDAEASSIRCFLSFPFVTPPPPQKLKHPPVRKHVP